MRAHNLLKGCGFLVQEGSGRILLDGFEPLSNGVFGEFENLAGAAFRDSYVTEAERLFLRVAFVPKVSPLVSAVRFALQVLAALAIASTSGRCQHYDRQA